VLIFQTVSNRVDKSARNPYDNAKGADLYYEEASTARRFPDYRIDAEVFARLPHFTD
jgi:hypothetical protein